MNEMLSLNSHPCFNRKVRGHSGRVHLPVAPKCNIQCNYCNRKTDCVNEGRPGVTSALLTPGQAIRYLDQVLTVDPRIKVSGIAGPGDPFANPDETLETFRLVRERFPEMLLCVATNGLNLLPFVEDLAKLQVSHVTVTINAIDPEIGKEVVSWVRDGKVVYRGFRAAEIILERQLTAVKELKRHGIIVKVNTIVIPGINDMHIEAIAQTISGLGVDLMNCIPLLPTEDTAFQTLPEPSTEQIRFIRQIAGTYLPQMEHCARCRADAVGLLGDHPSEADIINLREYANLPIIPDDNRPYVAVASMEGILVNQHLGEAERLLIYESTESGYRFLEHRQTPNSGLGALRWLKLSELLHDCQAVLVSAAGETPKNILTRQGVKVWEMEGFISDGLEGIDQGRGLEHLKRRNSSGCNGCKGTGMGCG